MITYYYLNSITNLGEITELAIFLSNPLCGIKAFNKTWTDPVDANAYAAELIKHTYREGWSLPDMPR